MKAFIKKFAGVVAVLALAFSVAFVPAVGVSAVQGGIQGGLDAAHNADTPKNLTGDGGIFTTIVNVMLFVVGALSVIMLIWGGIRYATSGGSSSAVTSAKNTIMYAIIGLVVAFLAYAIVNWVLFAVNPDSGAVTQ